MGRNIVGTYNVFEAAHRARVPRIAFASTNHVVGNYDRDRAWPIHPDQPIRTVGYYGVSKTFGEALARYFSDEFDMSMICLRIGWFLERPFNETSMRMWLSPRDMGQLIRRCPGAAVRFGLYYDVSDNTRSQWNLENARREPGYEPQNDSEVFAADIFPETAGASEGTIE